MLGSPQLGAPAGGRDGSPAAPRSDPVQMPPATAPMPPVAPLLADLLTGVDEAESSGDAAVAVTDVTHRSAEVRSGALFFCVPGEHVDGHAYASEAASRGASAIVVERWVGDLPVVQVRVPSVRRAMGPIASSFFERPSERMSLIGVTGTNGKTTTTYLLESIFVEAGLPSGVIGTTGVRILGRTVPFERTTPEAPDLQRLLRRMADEGVVTVAMEVSSHGLDQHRVDGTRYSCAVFTNLSQDHLDYHPSMQEYFDAKARLFTPELSERAVVNADVPEGRALARRSLVRTRTFGLEPGAEIRASDVEVTQSGISFSVDGLAIRSRLRGNFNVSNCLGALAAARAIGIDDATIARGIGALSGVPGRLEPVEAGQAFSVLVDYAHSPDSLDNVLRTIRDLTAGRVVVVFGCGGDRDRGKRRLMGRAATALADLSIITSDNPRSEEPGAIIAEIEPGAREGGGSYAVEADRRAAIRLALTEAHAGDVVLIAGKGHETGQEFRDRTLPFDDRITAIEELRSLGLTGDR